MSFEPRDAPYPELKGRTRWPTRVARGRISKPPPSAPVWAAVEGLGRYYILLAAIELDVFDALQRMGPSSAEDVAADVGASVEHLRSLLDGVVALELLDQFNDVYELNDTARRYLVSDGPATMAELIAVATGPHDNWTRLAETVRSGARQRPSKTTQQRSTSRSSRAHSRPCFGVPLGRISRSGTQPDRPRWFLIWGQAARRSRL